MGDHKPGQSEKESLLFFFWFYCCCCLLLFSLSPGTTLLPCLGRHCSSLTIPCPSYFVKPCLLLWSDLFVFVGGVAFLFLFFCHSFLHHPSPPFFLLSFGSAFMRLSSHTCFFLYLPFHFCLFPPFVSVSHRLHSLFVALS